MAGNSLAEYCKAPIIILKFCMTDISIAGSFAIDTLYSTAAFQISNDEGERENTKEY